MNKINWFQIPAADFARATKFYSDILGWQFHLQENEMGRHAFIQADAGAVSGEIFAHPYAKPSADGSRLFLAAPEGVAPTLARVEPAGGKIIMPATSIAPFGVIAIISDPEGNQVGLHNAK
jgi:uncharacterized protein